MIRDRKAPKTPLVVIILGLLTFATVAAQAQRVRGELHIEVRDPQGAALAATAELVSDVNQFHRTFTLATDGRYVMRDLAFGAYRLNLRTQGFAPWTELIQVQSEVPVYVSATLKLAAVSTELEVNGAGTLLDPDRSGTAYSVGQRAIREQISTQPGRDLADLVDDEPGWLYEANGVLHPRGSEYDVQYVVDGVPITQNRSPVFAPAFDAENIESMRILTAGYPAEYGRKLGGVVEVTSEKNVPSGFHGQLTASGGSFTTTDASAQLSYVTGKNHFCHQRRRLSHGPLSRSSGAGKLHQYSEC